MFNLSQLGNLGNIVEKTKDLKQQLEKIEETGTAGMGVSVTLNGKGECTQVSIAQDMMATNDLHILEDLIQTAINNAQERIRSRHKEETAKIFGDMPLPFDISKLVG